ncbi:molybdenum cofactor guanylyltransferase MobA [Nisaea acidiphila]|uniref:Molybdenum cofactor guanylyltransferase n=1 Tax=Nisaea acidiphila TaxID=1862145 RepID=A0A9J7AYM5_9PROT|nr:molybdenum cofactor guanylyltransferase MobA [Nisaea acidiphila]UUX50533.1 molybdenum cofactor guanylyltransferase MobA [Nisaea acidiphila]
MPIERQDIVGVLLAGGQSRRMGGGDKSLRMLAGRPILSHVIERVRGQVGTMVLNANGDPSRFSDFGLPVVADVIPGHQGPLAGVLTGMMWAKEHVLDAEWILTVATDAPFVPEDIAGRLTAAIEAEGADLACAESGGRNHPVIGLWPVRLAGNLRSAVLDQEIRKVDRWTANFRLSVVHFADEPTDPFFNINHPDDIQRAENALKLAIK